MGTLLTTTFILVGCGTEAEESNESYADYYELDDDIENIGNILGEYDIVILGESSHFSTDIANQKVEIIDHLAEAHGFNQLFLEANDSEFNYYQEAGLRVPDGMGALEVFDKYLDGSQNNIQVLAMDWSPAFTGRNTSAVPILERNIVEELSEYDLELAEEFKRTEFAIRDWFARGVFRNQNVGYLERSTSVYEDIRNESFFNQLTSETQNYIISKQENVDKYHTKISFEAGQDEYYDYREIGMSEKILDQMTEDDKAIIWVANGHSNYDVTSIEYTHELFIEENRNDREESLGALLRESEHSVYNVGLFHNEADDYELIPEDFPTPRKEEDETLEGYIGNRVQEDIFIDFATSDFIEEDQYTVFYQGLYHSKMVPQNQFDGLIYIDHIEH